MKPLTRYAMGTGMNVEPHMAPWPEGPYYRVDQVDARIKELEAASLEMTKAARHLMQQRDDAWSERDRLEAERDAARADAERLRGHMRYFVGNDFNRVRKQRDQAHKALERIAASRQEDYVSASQWAWACVQEATAIVGEQE